MLHLLVLYILRNKRSYYYYYYYSFRVNIMLINKTKRLFIYIDDCLGTASPALEGSFTMILITCI